MTEWIERALRKTTISEKGGCWLYDYDLSQKGYGRIIIGEKRIRIHRLSYETFRGAIPEDLMVCHKCDVRNCWNPDHLFTGTALDNVRDMIAKGRENLRRGSGPQKLTTDSAQSIINRVANGEAKRAVARDLGVGQGTVQKIVSGEIWKDLDRSCLLPRPVSATEGRSPPAGPSVAPIYTSVDANLPANG